MPHANKIWMLYGFAIFKAVRANRHEVIEVYPYAIVRALLREVRTKRAERVIGASWNRSRLRPNGCRSILNAR